MSTFLTSNLLLSLASSFAFLPDPAAGGSTSISSAMMWCVAVSHGTWSGLPKRCITVTWSDATASESTLNSCWLSFVGLIARSATSKRKPERSVCIPLPMY